MSSDAEREAWRRHPESANPAIEQLLEVARYNFSQGAEWERSRPVSDAEVEAARDALAGMDGVPAWWGGREFRDAARTVLEAAAKVREQGGTE